MKTFIKSFIAKKGIWVGSSLLISRLSTFLMSIIGARMLTPQDFGLATFGLNFLAIFLAVSGFGVAQGVLKFGSAITDQQKKEALFRYAFSYGLLYNFVLTAIMMIVALILYHGDISKIYLLLFFSIRFLGIYLTEQKKIEYRANMDNQSYAKLDIFLSISALILSFLLTYFWQLDGFLASLIFSPFLLFFYDRKFNFSLQKINLADINRKEFWRFSWTTALTTQVGELVFILDLFFIGLLLQDQDVAYYKVSTMIPMNILVLGFIFMQTEYPKLCQHHDDRKYQYHFIVNYWKLFTITGVIIYIIGSVFDKEILSIFGQQYQDTRIYKILLLTAVISLILRVLFVYMLAVIGKPIWNLFISLLMLLATSISLYIIIPVYGLLGVAYVTFGCLTLSGILPAIAYFYESKKI